MTECAYGQTFEPDPPAEAARVFRGQLDVARPVVLAPYYPLAGRAEAGGELPVKLVAVGERAGQHADALLAALADVGRAPGIGPDRVTFELPPAGPDDCQQGILTTADLPATPDALPGTLPRVGVGLTSPLFLNQRDDRGRRRPIERPEFGDLFRAALRTVGRRFALYASELPADFAALKQAAEEVRRVDDCFAPFEQVKWSSRAKDRYALRGCDGGAVFADVPPALVPWLYSGGRLHVGTHRVAGAGGWRLVLE